MKYIPLKLTGGKITNKTTVLILITILLFSVFTINPMTKTKTVNATVITVDDSGGANHTTIQEAINNATTGDTIYVNPGTYYESILINKSINLIGEDRDNTEIISNESTTITVNHSNVNINNLTIKATRTNSSSCIEIKETKQNITIENCNIKNGCNGIYISEATNIKIFHNNFYNNLNHGVELSTSRQWNKAYPTCGNYWDDYTGVDNYHGPNQDLPYYDNIGDTHYGIFGYASDHYPLMNPWTGSSPIPTDRILVDDDFDNSTYGYGIDHFDNIQDAIDNASTDATVNVMSGLYYENIEIDKKIKLIGEDKVDTIIDGENISDTILITADDVEVKNFIIKKAGGTTTNAGIKITSDNNNIYNNKIIQCDDGIHISNANNNKIQNNSIECYTGIYLGNSSNSNVITRNLVSNSYGTSGVAYGIFIGMSSNENQIYENKVSDFDIGIFFWGDSNNNLIYKNDFIDNDKNAEDQCTNTWDKGNTIGGNYYSDYDEPSEGAYDNNCDGKIDTPYTKMGGDNKDNYPLASFYDNQKPIANANGPYEVDIREDLTFTSTGSYDPDGTIVNYTWHFDDGEKGYGPNPTHEYITYGPFTVTLIVTDNQNLKGKDTTTVRIPFEEYEEDEEEENTTTETQNETYSNTEPVAILDEEHYGIIGIPLSFDGTESYDDDGEIVSHDWDFDDETYDTGETVEHTFNETGEYEISLTVTDNEDATDTTYATVIITSTPGLPPTKPIVAGETEGAINTSYNYTANSTDPDNDTIQYIFNWSDGTNDTISAYMNSSTVFNTSHKWTQPGIYTLKVYAKDTSNTTSQTTRLMVAIDAHYCSTLGYLLDKDNDGIYDSFYCNPYQNETPIKKVGEDYYIDIDNDSYYDYIYSFETGLSGYQDDIDIEKTEYNPLLIASILLGCITIIIIVRAALHYKKKPYEKIKTKKIKKEKPKKQKKKTKKPKHKKIKIKKRKKEKTKKPKHKKIKIKRRKKPKKNSEKKEIKNIEDEIDNILKKKK